MNGIESHQGIDSRLHIQIIRLLFAAKKGGGGKVKEIVREMEEDSEPSEDERLKSTNKDSAGKIAKTLRDKGEQKFGPMWSESNGVLPNGRGVHLQSSVDILEINILPTGRIPLNTHVRYDLTAGNYNTYEVRKPDGKPVIFYQEYDGSRSPIKLSGTEILNRVGEVLRQADLITSALSE